MRREWGLLLLYIDSRDHRDGQGGDAMSMAVYEGHYSHAFPPSSLLQYTEECHD